MRGNVYVVTGSASGIGAATRLLLEEQGARVIGVDLRDAEVQANLATHEGRQNMIAEVTRRVEGGLHGIVACAGVSLPQPITVSINYFGAVATLEGLRPLLTPGEGRAVAVASMAVLQPADPQIMEACLAGNEEAALQAAAAQEERGNGYSAYPSSKRALARWVRRSAPLPEWAGQGLPLNAVAPGVVQTAMTRDLTGSEEGRRVLAESVPMPLGGYAEAAEVARPILWLLSPENTKVTGQLLFVDGGADVVLRGDDIWG